MRDPLEAMYSESLCDPLKWFEHSRALMASARTTRERAELIINEIEKTKLMNVATMLYGYSIETLFKSIFIYRKFGSPHQSGWSSESEFPKEIRTHDLKKLAVLIGAKLIERDEFCLQLMSETTVWAGRYPCPINNETKMGGFSMPDTVEVAEELFKEHSKPFTTIS